MALQPCRECGETISTETATCPHCGVQRPAALTQRRSGPNATAIALFFAAFSVAGLFWVIADTSTPPDPNVPSQEEASFTMREYQIYRSVVDSPMSVGDDATMRSTAEDYEITTAEVRATVDRVQAILFENGWFGRPNSEIRHASDWKP